MMTRDQLHQYANEHPDGFTVSIKTGTAPVQGVCVAITRGMTLDAAYDAAVLLMTPDGPEPHVGGWQDGQDFIVDITYVVPAAGIATAIGTYFNQDALWNLDAGAQINLKEA